MKTCPDCSNGTLLTITKNFKFEKSDGTEAVIENAKFEVCDTCKTEFALPSTCEMIDELQDDTQIVSDLYILNIMLGTRNTIWLCSGDKKWLAGYILIDGNTVSIGTTKSDAKTPAQLRAFGIKWCNNINDEPHEIPYV